MLSAITKNLGLGIVGVLVVEKMAEHWDRTELKVTASEYEEGQKNLWKEQGHNPLHGRATAAF